jgi:hypothetical protein
MPSRPKVVHACPCAGCQQYEYTKYQCARTVHNHTLGQAVTLPCPCNNCDGELQLPTTVADHLVRYGPGRLAVVMGEESYPVEDDNIDDSVDQYQPPELFFDPYSNEAALPALIESDDDDEPAPDPRDAADQEVLPTEEYMSSVQSMAQQMIEAVAHDQVNQQGLTVVLKIMHGTVFRHCPSLLVSLIPADARVLKKTACIEKLPHHYRDFCPGPPQKATKSSLLEKQADHHLFAVDPTDVHCPMCKDDTRYFPGTTTPTRTALFYDLDGYLTRSYELQELRDLQMGWRQDDRMKKTPREYKWVMDGAIVKGGKGKIFNDVADNEEVVVFSGCRDATVISHMSNTSLLPVVFDNLALPERIRKAPESKYVAALFPPGMKATRVTQQPIAEMFARRQPGSEHSPRTTLLSIHKRNLRFCFISLDSIPQVLVARRCQWITQSTRETIQKRDMRLCVLSLLTSSMICGAWQVPLADSLPQPYAVLVCNAGRMHCECRLSM